MAMKKLWVLEILIILLELHKKYLMNGEMNRIRKLAIL